MNCKIICFGMVALLVSSAAPAWSQMVCGERPEIVRALEDGHSEQKTAAGISGNGALVELFTAATGTWTLLLTMPGGPTCLLGSGDEWEGFEPGDRRKKRRSTFVVPPVDHT